jgi:uncharacterized protein (DUF1015 family)
MQIRAFQPWRPANDLAPRLSCPPYDVVSTAEARAAAAGNAMCFFHVSRAEIDLPDDTPSTAPEVYARAAANWRAFRERGWMVREDAPRLYVYRLRAGGHSQTGLVALCLADDYDRGVIRRHENTRQATEDDRTRHIEALNAQSGPVFLAHRGRPDIDALAAAVQAGAPLHDFDAPDGVRHTVWTVPDPAPFVRAFAGLDGAYVADGHHRAAAAARVARARRAPGAQPGNAESDWFLAVLFPAGQLRILPYNRVARDLNGLAPDAFLRRVRGLFEVSEDAPPAPPAPGRAAMYLGGRWYGLAWGPPPAHDPVAALDVSVLQNRLLGPVLGIDDPRLSDRIAFVGGIRGADELRRRVDAGEAAVAFSLYPTSVAQLLDVSDAGRTMPPKSTWFEPKLRSGLFVHALD